MRVRELVRGALRCFGEINYPAGANCLCCGDRRRADAHTGLCPDCAREVEALRVPASACDRCLSRIGRGEKCRLCASPRMRDIDRVYAPYIYQGAVRTLIRKFKFDACDEALETLGPAMADALRRFDYDLIVPVPLHRSRLTERGVNQAMLLAGRLSVRTGVRAEEALTRDRSRRAQSKTAYEKRAANVAGVFKCAKNVTDKRILLVDDVRTSGSTAAECAGVLRRAGAARVDLCAAAVVYRHR